MANERNILASFTDPEHAYTCARALRAQGFDVVEVDDLPTTGSDPAGLPHAPMVDWGRYGYREDVLDDKWTAPSSWSHDGLVVGEGWLLTAVIPAERYEEAAAIVRRAGGRF